MAKKQSSNDSGTAVADPVLPETTGVEIPPPDTVTAPTEIAAPEPEPAKAGTTSAEPEPAKANIKPGVRKLTLNQARALHRQNRTA